MNGVVTQSGLGTSVVIESRFQVGLALGEAGARGRGRAGGVAGLITTALEAERLRGNRANRGGEGSWLPDMDLNHDKQIQSLLCYRYTIGQSVGRRR